MSGIETSILEVVFKIHVLLLQAFADYRLVLTLLVGCTILSLLKIRSLAVPIIKLAVVYYMAFVSALAAMYGHEDLLSMRSLMHLRRTVKAAIIATAVCFFIGLATPKKARQGPKA